MRRLLHIFVWLSRIHCCRGFGIQSPTDYQFVCYVINEHWPYYAYDTLGAEDGWLERKLGLLYFRLANWRQPRLVVDEADAAKYVVAGCQSAKVVGHAEPIELAIVPLTSRCIDLLAQCDDRSVVVVTNISGNKSLWKQLLADKRVSVSYDLYYCGILMFDSKRVKQHYKINF